MHQFLGGTIVPPLPPHIRGHAPGPPQPLKRVHIANIGNNWELACNNPPNNRRIIAKLFNK